MTTIDQVLTMIGEQVAGMTDESDVKQLLRAGKPTQLFEASASGENRSELICQAIQAEISQRWGSEPSIAQILMRVLSSHAHPYRLFESLALSNLLISHTSRVKMLDYVDEGLGDQLQVTLLVWTSN